MKPDQQDTLYQSYDKDLYKITGSESQDSIMATMGSEQQGNATNAGMLVTAASDIGSGSSTATVDQMTGTIKSGKNQFDNTETGYIMGIDGKDGLAKFYIGNPTNYLNWTGTQLIISGNISATTGTIGGFTIGATTISSGNLIIDSATPKITLGVSPNQIILDGSTGVISSEGSQWSLNGDGTVSGFSSGYQVFIFSSSGTFIPPRGVTTVLVDIVGGGGGGGAGSAVLNASGGGGGGGAGLENAPSVVTELVSYAVTVGAAGAGGVAPTSGGTSSFNGISCVGGQPGTNGGGGPGSGGAAGDSTAGAGGAAFNPGSAGTGGGAGGGGPSGGGGGASGLGTSGGSGAGTSASPGADGYSGSGGGGGSYGGAGGSNGGAGGKGIVIIKVPISQII